VSLEATLRVEDARPHHVLRARLPFVGRHRAKLRRSPFTEYGRAGNLAFCPHIATFLCGEVHRCQPRERARFAVDDHVRVGKRPCGRPCSLRMIVTDTKSPVTLEGVDLQAHRGCRTDGVGEVRAGRRDAANEGGTHGPGARAN
jgi:hypothetical protein